MFNKTWFITTIGTWLFILALDELAYYWWKDYHPDSMFSGVIAKHPLQMPQSPQAGTQYAGNQ